MMMAYARSARHAARGRFAFALAPLYGLLHILVPTPVRMYALASLRGGDCGTVHPWSGGWVAEADR
jgi:hypothetical protein